MKPEQVAKHLVYLVGEHGAPNFFELRELAWQLGSSVLELSRIGRCELLIVNEQLKPHKLRAIYHYRSYPTPAGFNIFNILEDL